MMIIKFNTVNQLIFAAIFFLDCRTRLYKNNVQYVLMVIFAAIYFQEFSVFCENRESKSLAKINLFTIFVHNFIRKEKGKKVPIN